jgi:hypothetical protein
MFVQIIEGQVADAARLAHQLDRWGAELRAGAAGFIGSTAGITDDGRAIVVARFESAEAAQANSARPEQTAWWTETETCFDGPVTFTESTEVEAFLAGGSDGAGFVQVMEGTHADRDRLHQLDEVLEEVAPEVRPDLLGGFRAWTAPDAYVEVAYFTTEAEARAGERAMPDEIGQQMADLEAAMGDVEYLDLRHPILV